MKIARAPWKDTAELAGHKAWKKRADASGGRDPETLRMYMVRGLVNEVLVAGGGIERELRALKAAQALADASASTIPDPVRRSEKGPLTVGPPGAALDSAYATMNALTWIRGVHERILRDDDEDADLWLRFLQWFGRTKLGDWSGVGRPKTKVAAGLLPSLQDGQPKTTIDTEFKTLRPKLHEARKFSNYALHSGSLPGGQTPGFHMLPNRTVYFPFPDQPSTRRFFTWDEFTYSKERTALGYIEDQFDVIATFVDRMLDAFEALP